MIEAKELRTSKVIKKTLAGLEIYPYSSQNLVKQPKIFLH